MSEFEKQVKKALIDRNMTMGDLAEALVSSVSRTDTTMVEVLAAINNSNLNSGYYVKALGLFAKDIEDNEILYAVSIETDNPDYMPAFGGKTHIQDEYQG